MKDKNRFSILLEHLMAIAELKIVFLQKLFSMMTPISVNGLAENCCQLKKIMKIHFRLSVTVLLKLFRKKALHNYYRNISYRISKILKLLFMTISKRIRDC